MILACLWGGSPQISLGSRGNSEEIFNYLDIACEIYKSSIFQPVSGCLWLMSCMPQHAWGGPGSKAHRVPLPWLKTCPHRKSPLPVRHAGWPFSSDCHRGNTPQSTCLVNGLQASKRVSYWTALLFSSALTFPSPVLALGTRKWKLCVLKDRHPHLQCGRPVWELREAPCSLPLPLLV